MTRLAVIEEGDAEHAVKHSRGYLKHGQASSMHVRQFLAGSAWLVRQYCIRSLKLLVQALVYKENLHRKLMGILRPILRGQDSL